jgi:hypothetical protein
MDTSETYIKQCEKAVEIQELRDDKELENTVNINTLSPYTRYQNGDFIYYKGFKDPDKEDTLRQKSLWVPIIEVYFYSFYFDDLSNIIYWWLPRQDQLQEMIEKKNTRELLMRFTDWVEKETNSRRESMEQLWLAFVMWTLYQKKWNGEDWVKGA